MMFFLMGFSIRFCHRNANLAKCEIDSLIIFLAVGFKKIARKNVYDGVIKKGLFMLCDGVDGVVYMFPIYAYRTTTRSAFCAR